MKLTWLVLGPNVRALWSVTGSVSGRSRRWLVDWTDDGKEQTGEEEEEEEREGLQVEWLNKMMTEPYYLLHFLTFFSNLPIRASASLVLAPRLLGLLLRREIQAFLTFLVLTSVKMVREETWEGFIADTFLFVKIFLIVLSLLIDYHLTLWYIVVFLGSSSKLAPLQLETALVEGASSKLNSALRAPHHAYALVDAFQSFHSHSNKNLSFGIVDVGIFPNIAEKFGISLGGVEQTPTYILFEKATEVARFPEFGSGFRSFLSPNTKCCLVQHFDLDRLLIEYVTGQ